ncbi:hypothetical protein BJD20_13255 [Acinetobacter proteolyticus]|uniref:hypothetical protein n=1 Tax=Acinetobacter proteolyticus TaxID=1776741 RepID=UPI00086317E0|nr:hypothetical protein [Acinetobacter proteolyticus]OEY96066.1 hypothetical protein BJD20_13255 [Acinetobacter proteolyticus]
MKRDTELTALYRHGFDLGLDSESTQLRTTLQMREMAIKSHKKHLVEIDDWIKNQERGLKDRIKKIEEQSQ